MNDAPVRDNDFDTFTKSTGIFQYFHIKYRRHKSNSMQKCQPIIFCVVAPLTLHSTTLSERVVGCNHEAESKRGITSRQHEGS